VLDWLTGAPDPSVRVPASGESVPEAMPARIGRYPIERMLGQGGMGIVYAARDERLQRSVAIKTIAAVGDQSGRQRLWREARTAALVNHPNVCQIYDVGEDAGRVFIAMELLEGESLADRLRHGPMSPRQALPIAMEMLGALATLHARGILHRDLKPSNVFLTPHGVKLLDFGLARHEIAESVETIEGLTRPGVVVGTPRYMSPEQVAGEPLDARSDVFAAGAILFEMLAGRPAFTGHTIADVLHATRYEHPPALTGSPAIAATDRVLRRALAKRPDERLPSADAMLDELRAVTLGDSGHTPPAVARALTRVVVLPFRALRPDPDVDFLTYSLPDAVATSLSANPALVLRSNAVAARFAGDVPDLKAIAKEADVDHAVMGTILRAGDRLRVSAQLVEVPAGTLLSSHTAESSMGDLFALQDDIATRVASAMSLPLAGSGTAPDAPADPRAYELYLRANELARSYEGVRSARVLYEQCVALDSRFAPAWAQLGRCHRVIGKYIEPSADSETRAEQALRRALSVNPRLTIAHKYFAHLEADTGRTHDALVRLLEELSRHGNDPELVAGLVHACRYCGLFDQSVAAHHEARRLDPNVPTSLDGTLLLMGDIDELLALRTATLFAGADDGIRVIGLGFAGRTEEAKVRVAVMRQSPRIPLFDAWIKYLEAWLEGRTEDMTGRDELVGGLTIADDPEAIFQEGWMRCHVGQHEAGLVHLQRAVAKGFFPVATLTTRPQFEGLRGDARFEALVREAEAGRDRALTAFREAGGPRLLGV
jgi:serine/threonine-protein kinase